MTETISNKNIPKTNNDSSSSLSNVSSASSSASASRQATKTRIISLANELLAMCSNTTTNRNRFASTSIPTKITNVRQVNSNLFVLFYEELCNTELVGEFIFIYVRVDAQFL